VAIANGGSLHLGDVSATNTTQRLQQRQCIHHAKREPGIQVGPALVSKGDREHRTGDGSITLIRVAGTSTSPDDILDGTKHGGTVNGALLSRRRRHASLVTYRHQSRCPLNGNLSSGQSGIYRQRHRGISDTAGVLSWHVTHSVTSTSPIAR